jgi:uncharacterized membrane protein
MPNDATPTGSFDLNRPTIISLLLMASWVTAGVTGLIGGVLAFVWRGEQHQPWEGTHYDYLVNTFLIGLIGAVVATVLTMTIILFFIGIPLGIATAVWATVRAVLSLLNAQKREPMPNPQSWTI